MARETFPGNDEPVSIQGEPDEVLKALLGDDVGEGDSDAVEQVLDR